MELDPLAVAVTSTVTALLLAILATWRAATTRKPVGIGLAATLWLLTAGMGWMTWTAPNRAAWQGGDRMTPAELAEIEAEREARGLPFALNMTFDRFQTESFGDPRYESPTDPTVTPEDRAAWVAWAADLMEDLPFRLIAPDPWCDSFADHLIASELATAGETLDYAAGPVAYHERRIDLFQQAIARGGYGPTVRSCLVQAQQDEVARLNDAPR